MTKRKNTIPAKPRAEYDSGRETGVLLEEINLGIKTIGEQHGTIIKRLDNIESTLEQHAQELQIIKAAVHANSSELNNVKSEVNSVKMAVMEVDAKVNKIDNRLTVVETKLTSVDNRLAVVETKFTSVETKLTTVDTRVGGLEKVTGRIEQKLDTSISQNEERFKRVETKLEMV